MPKMENAHDNYFGMDVRREIVSEAESRPCCLLVKVEKFEF